MTTKVQQCPIWRVEDGLDAIYLPGTGEYQVDNSPRAGGAYIIPQPLVDSDVNYMTVAQKARLTTWLISQRLQGNPQPTITEPVIKAVKDKPSLPVHERAERLLRYIAQHIGTVGQTLILGPEDLAAYAWSESTEWHEIVYCFAYLLQVGLARGRIGGDSLYDCEVSVDGYRHIAEQAGNVDSSQAFVAMWFGDSIANAYEDGIEAGIRDAGFSPLRIDRKDHINKIEDEIIAEIRRSRFVVADFSQGDDGARGGVYYEAGFAHGLDLPVIFTCHEKSLKDLHFDTAHYSHIVWADPAELREKLKNRILAVIRQGPVSNHTG